MKFRVQSVHFCSSSTASRAAGGAKSDSTHSNFIMCSFHLFSILLFNTDRVSNPSKMRSRMQFHHFCCLFAAFSAFQVRPLVSSSADGVARIKVIQLIQTPLSLQQHSQDDSIQRTCDVNLRMETMIYFVHLDSVTTCWKFCNLLCSILYVRCPIPSQCYASQ